MLIGNQQAQDTITTYLQAFLDGKHITPFLVLQGPGGVGKMTMITKLIKQHMGQYRHTDAKIARNLSKVLGKSHSFKVEVSSSDQQIIDKETGTIYDNPGSRDLRGRLARAPLGDLKVVIIEDIDRMTISAANALLKEFEEPLPNRIIIGTVDAGKKILDTILSRAFLVKFHTVSSESMKALLPSNIETDLGEFILSMSRGRPGVVKQLLAKHDEIKQLQDILQKTQYYLKQGGSIVDQMNRIKQRKELGWSSDSLLEALLASETIYREPQLIQARKRLLSNVNEDNIMRDVML